MYDQTFIPDYYKQKIAVVGDSNYFIKYRDALAMCIREYGFDAKVYSEIRMALSDNPTCVIVICPQLFHKPPKRKDVFWVMVQTEQLFDKIGQNHLFLKKNLIRVKPYLAHYDLILETCYNNIEGLKKITRTPVEFFSAGCYEKQVFNSNSVQNKDYDLIFIGDRNGIFNRRKNLLEYLCKRYKVFPEVDGLWGDERDNAIAKCRIGINIHYEEGRYSDSMRLNMLIKNKCFVLSEPIDYPYPYVANEDYGEFILTNVCERIDYYLSHEEERKKIIEHAYNKYYSKNMRDSIKVLIDWIILKSYNEYLENYMSFRAKLYYYYSKKKENRKRKLLE